jgi:DNA-binding response OmpR family regulator
MDRKPIKEMSRQEMADHIEALEETLAVLDRDAGLDASISPYQNRMLIALLESRGRPLSYEQLSAAMSFDRPDFDWCGERTVKVLMCRLRKAVKGRYNIRTVWGRGYVLDAGQALQ